MKKLCLPLLRSRIKVSIIAEILGTPTENLVVLVGRYLFETRKDPSWCDWFCVILANIGPRGERGKVKKSGYGSGKQTLRFKAGGAAVVEVTDDSVDKAVAGINNVLENFLGISDTELGGSAFC